MAERSSGSPRFAMALTADARAHRRNLVLGDRLEDLGAHTAEGDETHPRLESDLGQLLRVFQHLELRFEERLAGFPLTCQDRVVDVTRHRVSEEVEGAAHMCPSLAWTQCGGVFNVTTKRVAAVY